MQEKGLAEEEVLAKLDQRLKNDMRYFNGKILSSMCSEPLDISKKAYQIALGRNLGDKSLFPDSADLEKEVVSMLGHLLSNPNAAGHIVSGGTEANIMALWIAKKQNKDERNEVILPTSAHYSFETAADILGLKLVQIPLTDEFKIDIPKVITALNRKTLVIVGVAGSTGLGVVDPIPKLSDISLEYGVHLHIDAAFGGFVLPFLKDLALYEGGFDFESPGVKSITIDPHKMGLCPIPAGGILFRDESLLSTIGKSVSYIGSGRVKLTTLSGTRPAAPAIAVWAAMKSLGRSGYRTIVEKCINNTTFFCKQLEKLEGVRLIVKPTMNIVGFTCLEVSNKMVIDKLLEKGWTLSLFPTHIRAVIMPHTDAYHLKKFISDLNSVLVSLKKTKIFF